MSKKAPGYKFRERERRLKWIKKLLERQCERSITRGHINNIKNEDKERSAEKV